VEMLFITHAAAKKLKFNNQHILHIMDSPGGARSNGF